MQPGSSCFSDVEQVHELPGGQFFTCGGGSFKDLVLLVVVVLRHLGLQTVRARSPWPGKMTAEANVEVRSSEERNRTPGGLVLLGVQARPQSRQQQHMALPRGPRRPLCEVQMAGTVFGVHSARSRRQPRDGTG
ncbi:hypothetical protein ACFWZK_20700 [[Kitasatospora] papulosa]|uniref:hypothetical protein n=1 Tax=Streptomyces TaxID=1883 RepID=UPI003409884C